eukprot:scaffold90036_cov55-Attheya_sp.AAC.1
MRLDEMGKRQHIIYVNVTLGVNEAMDLLMYSCVGWESTLSKRNEKPEHFGKKALLKVTELQETCATPSNAVPSVPLKAFPFERI